MYIRTASGFQVPIYQNDPSNPKDGDMWYNSTENVFKIQEDGTTKLLVSGGDAYLTEVLPNNSSGFIFTYPKSFKGAVVKYYQERDGMVKAGELMIAASGTSASLTDYGTKTGEIGLSLEAVIDGDDVRLLYTTTDTGFNVNFRYNLKRW